MPDVSTALRFARHDEGHLAAFTLIELLVVISVIVMLVAILLPTVHRVRKQAAGTVCQSKLRQWAFLFSPDTTQDLDKPVFRPERARWIGPLYGWPEGEWLPEMVYRYGPQVRDLFLCPIASRPERADGQGARGSTFYTWCFARAADQKGPVVDKGSYGINPGVYNMGIPSVDGEKYSGSAHWAAPPPGTEAAYVPVLLDSGCVVAWYMDYRSPPPPYEGCPSSGYDICINRHDGGINVLFVDWSVHKVGLKELWTLRWNRDFDPRGPWTKAGGVKPEDWPQWLRRFKDY